jgi:hypothetical protein
MGGGGMMLWEDGFVWRRLGGGGGWGIVGKAGVGISVGVVDVVGHTMG